MSDVRSNILVVEISDPVMLCLSSLQQVYGVYYTAYLADQAACDTSLIAVIAACAYTPLSSVKNLTVTGTSRHRASSTDGSVARMHLRAATKVRVSAAAESVTLQYYVVMPVSSGATYQEMSYLLTDCVVSGSFTGELRSYAYDTPAPALVNASSDSVQTQEAFPGDDSDGGDGNSTTLSIGAIVGIAIGGFAALLIIAYLTFCLCKTRPESSDQGKVLLHCYRETPLAPDVFICFSVQHTASVSAHTAKATVYSTNRAQDDTKRSAVNQLPRGRAQDRDTRNFENPMRGAKPSRGSAYASVAGRTEML